jgi:hypothetical protein
VLPEADMKSKSWICWEKICLVYVKKDKIYVNILTVFQQYFIYDTTFSIIGCLPGKADPAIKRGGFGDTKVVVRIRHIFVPVPTRAWISSVMCCGLFSVICNYVSSIKFDGGHKKNKKKKEILNSFDGERQFPFPQYQRNEHEIIYIIIYQYQCYQNIPERHNSLQILDCSFSF